MPVVVMHGAGSGGGGNCTLSSKSSEPDSHLCISLIAVLVNPLFGLFAVIFSCWSRKTASMDWDGAQAKGRIALWCAVIGLVITVVGALIFVLVVFTKDT